MHRMVLSAIALAGGLSIAAQAMCNPLPHFIVKGSISVTEYTGIPDAAGNVDDLLSAGLNAPGLQSATAPAPADPLNPSAEELRRLAIYTNFRAITDMTSDGGYGLFWGPALAPSFGPEVAPGLIPGVEYKALMRVPAPSRHVNRVPVAVQIPTHFNADDPCVFLAPPSGSRGNYGGIAVGEWGLFEGCAVVLPGKATGTGFHLLESDDVYDRDGLLAPADELGRDAQFAVKRSPQLERFLDDHPQRIATKHAHSQINPERLWGKLALQAVEFALWALNDRFADSHTHRADMDRSRKHRRHTAHHRRFRADNTLVIASGTSNAAGVTLRAVEDDRHRLIDAAVVIEPNINPNSAGKFSIDFGGEVFTGHGTSLYDNHTLMSIYAPCAALSPTLAGTPLNFDPLGAPAGARAMRCASLAERGLVSGGSLEQQANSALAVLRANGYYAEQDTLLASHEWLNLWRSLNPTYAAAHGRMAVWDNVCDISFAAIDATGAPLAWDRALAASAFSTSGGIPATAGVALINDAAANGPISENLSISPSTGRMDLNLDGARCFRYLATGDERWLDGAPSARDRHHRRRVQRGIDETLTSADLHGTPTIILAGRSDALVFPNFHARPYYGLNQVVEGAASHLSYIEVVNAQHFEAFISTFWLDPVSGVQFVPLHYYLFQALHWMRDYLKGSRTSLPPSQIVRPVPRGLTAYTSASPGTAMLPAIQDNPAQGDRIVFEDRVLTIPK